LILDEDSNIPWSDPGNHILFMMTTILLFSTWVSAQEKEVVVIGEKVKMRSDILDKEVHLTIHVPAGSEDPSDQGIARTV
jgi:hypothetical protein